MTHYTIWCLLLLYIAMTDTVIAHAWWMMIKVYRALAPCSGYVPRSEVERTVSVVGCVSHGSSCTRRCLCSLPVMRGGNNRCLHATPWTTRP